ncbi:hypothetical protein CY35_01G023600 [Sphagnum magellanicum]|nr:hypothetical protein CY35_01G023600 [Sphagnum magellanicum]
MPSKKHVRNKKFPDRREDGYLVFPFMQVSGLCATIDILIVFYFPSWQKGCLHGK